MFFSLLLHIFSYNNLNICIDAHYARKPMTLNLKKSSLNQDVRKREIVKIAIENQEILKRLENKKSAYNIKTWQKNRENAEKYLANISEYPLKMPSDFERNQVKTAENNFKRTGFLNKTKESEGFY